jgi:hypothetical protein
MQHAPTAHRSPISSRSVAHEKRGARLRPARPTGRRPAGARLACAAALALTAALAVAGCASATAGTTASSANTSGAPAFTQADAAQVFDAYVTASTRAAQTDDGKLALSVVTGALQSLISATLNSHPVNISGSDSSAYSSTLNVLPSLGQYTYGHPTFYLPEPADYPRFFLADVNRALTFRGLSVGKGATGSVGGVQVPVNGPALMLFVQSAAAGPWQLASVDQFPAGMTLPRLATDKNGDIPQVPLMSTDLLAQPYATGPLQAAVVDDGPASAAAKAVAAGLLTTGLYQAARDRYQEAGDRTLSGLEVPAGDVYQWSMEGTPYPAFALRTADGGALVLYAMYLNSTVAIPGYIDDASPLQPGPPIKAPPDVLSLLPSGQPAPRVQLTAQSLFSFAAIDPPAGSSKITVLAIGGGLNYANAT